MNKFLQDTKKFLLENFFWNYIISYRRVQHLPPRVRIFSMILGTLLGAFVTCLFAKWMTGSFLGSWTFWASIFAFQFTSAIIIRRCADKLFLSSPLWGRYQRPKLQINLDPETCLRYGYPPMKIQSKKSKP